MSDPPRSNVDSYGFEWPKDFDHNEYEEFMSKYLTILSRRARKWDILLNSKEGIRKSNKVKRYIRKGIPGGQRGTIWTAISGAKQLRDQNPELYKTLLKGPMKQEIIETITLDIPRTFPDNIYFKGSSNDSKRNSLYNVLLAFAHQNPQIGYCQGLNFIAGIMLLVTDSEETTFWLLQSLVEEILPDYYTKQMTGLLTDIGVLEELIRSKVPQVHNHMVRTGVSWSMYVSKWFICLFAEVLPIETVLRIWDCLFYEGSKILLRVAVTLVVRNQDKILAAGNFVEITDVFKSLPSGANVKDCHTFMQAVFRVPGSFPRAQIAKLRELCRKKVEEEQEATKVLQQQQQQRQLAEQQARAEALEEQKRKEEEEAKQRAAEEAEQQAQQTDLSPAETDEEVKVKPDNSDEVQEIKESIKGQRDEETENIEDHQTLEATKIVNEDGEGASSTGSVQRDYKTDQQEIVKESEEIKKEEVISVTKQEQRQLIVNGEHSHVIESEQNTASAQIKLETGDGPHM